MWWRTRFRSKIYSSFICQHFGTWKTKGSADYTLVLGTHNTQVTENRNGFLNLERNKE